MKKTLFTIFAVVLLSRRAQIIKNTTTLDYPETKKVDTVDVYFGTEVKDPYRWLENDRSAETEAWVKAENEVTFGYLEKIPFREQLKQRLSDLWNYEKIGAPSKEGFYIYFAKNDGLQNQYVIYRKKSENDTPEVFLDPNKFSEDGTTSLGEMNFSENGKILAYSISEGGSDWRKIIVMDAESREITEDTLMDVKFSGVSWKGDEGFYYSSYDKPEGANCLQRQISTSSTITNWEPRRATTNLSLAEVRSRAPLCWRKRF